MYTLHNTIKSKSLTRTSNIRIYKTVIRPVLMYDFETWTLTKETKRKLLDILRGESSEESLGLITTYFKRLNPNV
ncbi:unnamed protein product [Diabrotica balteata]|uniref:Uncharacterized protein n=1 Tax=Diabrotica balteata TaxID=107213 RepID=A0A9N9SNS8_DIABA|nr:unnamed protein product [Diabrotica balteata]